MRRMRPRQETRSPLVPSIPDEVWADIEIQTAIAVQDFGRASRLVRERVGLRQDDMAFMTGLSQSFVPICRSVPWPRPGRRSG
jgi:hypothetical protein